MGCTCQFLHADVRPGGYYHIRQELPNGHYVYCRFDFREINPVERLIFVTGLCDEKGELVSNPFFSDWPRKLLTTVNFEEEGSCTKVTVLWEPLDASDAELAFFMQNLFIGHQGWSETFVRLESAIGELEPVA